MQPKVSLRNIAVAFAMFSPSVLFDSLAYEAPLKTSPNCAPDAYRVLLKEKYAYEQSFKDHVAFVGTYSYIRYRPLHRKDGDGLPNVYYGEWVNATLLAIIRSDAAVESVECITSTLFPDDDIYCEFLSPTHCA